MALFPQLNSGAVMQYPAEQMINQPVGVLRFLDGTDQRWLTRGNQLRQWLINVNLLTEEELDAFKLFFEDQLGDYAAFDFPDPFSNSSVPNCRFRDAELVCSYLSTGVGSTSFWVVETND